MRPVLAAIFGILALPALMSALAFGAPDPAAGAPGAGGDWAVKGRVLLFSFTLHCRFDQHGERLGGVCYDGGTNRPHPLTAGQVSGDRISWTYQSSYQGHPFDAVYAGRLHGDSMQGSVHAPGKSGVFSAAKQ